MQGKAENVGRLDNNYETTIKSTISDEKTKLLYQNLIISLPSNLICATLVYVSLATLHNSFVLLWFICSIAITTLRLITYYLYKDRLQKDKLVVFVIGTLLSAIIWGLAATYLMSHANHLQQMIIIVILAGVTAGSNQSLQANLALNMTYAIVVIAPLCLGLLIKSEESYIILGVSIGIYLIFMVVLAKRGYALLEDTLTLRFENLGLVNNLTHTNEQLQKSYQSEQEVRQTLSEIQENTPIGMALLSLHGRWLEVNHALCEILGYTKDELKQLSLQKITYQEDLEKNVSMIDSLIENKSKSIQMEERYIHKNGQLIWVLLTATLMHDKDGKPLYFIVQILNINQRKENEKIMSDLMEQTSNMLTELRQREYEMSLINKMNDMLQICQQSDEAYSTISLMANKFFPLLNGALITCKQGNQMETRQQWGETNFLPDIFTIEDCWALRKGQIYYIENTEKEVTCLHFIKKPPSYVCLPLIIQNHVNGLLCLMGDAIPLHQQQLALTFSEVIKLSLANIQLREALKDQALHDTLTGLFNRRHLEEMLPREISRVIRQKSTLCVAMLDVDYFKSINDRYGHDAGDEILRFIGNLLKVKFRDNDIACRYGGEEFLLILVDTNIHDAVIRLKDCCDKIKMADLMFEGKPLPKITVSVGIAELPTNGTSVDTIIGAADEALYAAKQAGRNRIEVYASKQ